MNFEPVKGALNNAADYLNKKRDEYAPPVTPEQRQDAMDKYNESSKEMEKWFKYHA